MKFADKLDFIRQNLKQNRSRNFMTILAIVISTAFLISLASVGFGLQKSFVKELTQGRKMTEIQLNGKAGDDSLIYQKDIKMIQKMAHVKGVSYRNELMQSPQFSIGTYKASQNAIFMNMKQEKKTGFKLAKGQFPLAKDEIVVGDDFAKQLLDTTITKGETAQTEKENEKWQKKYSYKENVLGKTIKMRITQFEGDKEITKDFSLKIVGIATPPARDYMQDGSVYASDDLYADVMAFTGTKNAEIAPSPEDITADMKPTDDSGYSMVYVYGDSLEHMSALSDTLKKKDYYVYSVADEIKSLQTVFMVFKIGLIFIGVIAVAIASIGIFNTMTMAVTERTREIGILKSMGCRPSLIRQLFLMETCYLAIVGLIWGIIISYLISFGLNQAVPMILTAYHVEGIPSGFRFSDIPFTLVLIATVISLLVALISGVRPARKATQIDVISALKN